MRWFEQDTSKTRRIITQFPPPCKVKAQTDARKCEVTSVIYAVCSIPNIRLFLCKGGGLSWTPVEVEGVIVNSMAVV